MPSQLRSAWGPAQLNCVPTNTDISLLHLISMLVTDIALLLMMLVGLFRLRIHDDGVFDLAQYLWKQVRKWFQLTTILRLVDTFAVYKGVSWLFVIVAAEVPPVVRLANFHLILVSFISTPRPRYSRF